MAKIINNTDLDKIAQTIANGKKDKQSLGTQSSSRRMEFAIQAGDINLERNYHMKKGKK